MGGLPQSCQIAPAAVPADAFRAIMGSLPTGITVVTTRDIDDVPRGLTVNACASVSLDPPLLLVCLNRHSSSLRALQRTSAFAVNVLASSQEWLARRFADRDPDKFADLACRSGLAGVPILPDVLASAECQVVKLVEAGDHTVVIGLVVDGQASDGQPLVYFQRSYRPIPAPRDA